MDLNYLKKLVRIIENSGVDEIAIEEEGIKVKISRHPHNNSLPVQSAAAAAAAPRTSAQEEANAAQAASTHHEIKSPIVGTFYRSPAPDADPYVEVGQAVQAGTVLCIIEAMKLMNEIESDVSGKIVKINVENGQPVEYNQPLFLIEPL